jgi:hypothetical protein
MKSTLTIINLKELPSGWQKEFPFDFLSVKPTRKVLGIPVDQIAEAKKKVPAGVDIHVWEWFPATTPLEGQRFGERMGKLCLKHNIKRFKINAEAQWAGVDKFPRTADPYHTLLEFVTSFRLFAPDDCELWFNGFSWSRTSDGRKLYDEQLLNLFDGRLVMTHGTNAGALVRSGEAKLAKWPKIPMIMQAGVGRVDAQGATWGFWASYKALIRKVPGMKEIDWFFGNGAQARYFQNSKHYPALVTCAKEVKSLCT